MIDQPVPAPDFDGQTFIQWRDGERLARRVTFYIDHSRRKREMARAACAQCGQEFCRPARRAKLEPMLYCGKECYRKIRSSEDAGRFWSNVNKRESGCWEWKGAPLQNMPYGRLRVRGIQVKAHRYAYELTHGPIGDTKIMVCHKCDNPICVNPDHLFLGSAAENMRDMIAKGRHRGGRVLGGVKVTPEARAEIRAARDGGEPVRSIALRYNISTTYAYDIVSGHYAYERQSVAP